MTELEMKAKLYQKLWEVFQEVDYVQKDKSVSIREKRAYNYASESAIKAAFHKALVKNRLLFLPYDSQLEPAREVRSIDQYNKERVSIITPVKLFYRFIDIDTGYSYEGAMHGMGGDALDKGLYKDITGAFKYIFHTSFVLPTGDDPEGGEEREDAGNRKYTKEEKQQAHAEQQNIAERKIAQLQAGQPVGSWDWRIALPRFEALEQKHGKAEVSIALKMAGYNSLEETPSREAALAAYEKVRATLAKAATEQPEWVDKPYSKPGPPLKPTPQLEKAADPLHRMLDRMDSFKGRLTVIQQHKYDLVQKYGQKEGEQRYYDVLDKHSGHNDTHANEIARHADKSRAVASELWLELHPEAVEEEVPA